jgi:hypothetical protein
MKFIDINANVDRIMKNPHINFFIIMNLILIISCYSLMNDHNKYSIKYFFSNPYITLISIIGIIIIGYFNINVAILCLVLLFIIIYTYPSSSTDIEGFTFENKPLVVNSFEDIKRVKKEYSAKANSKIEKQNKDAKKQLKDDNNNNLENKIKSVTKVFTDQLHVPEQAATHEFKQGLLENKQKILEVEQNHNSNKKTKNNKRKKENFQTVELRSFDPSNEVDTNLLITKEILNDMINRIEFNYETVPYLKKYLRHRLEEMIDINKLLNDDDDE